CARPRAAATAYLAPRHLRRASPLPRVSAPPPATRSPYTTLFRSHRPIRDREGHRASPGGSARSGGGSAMKARTLAARDGFSLVEVLVATVILAVGFLAMAATTGAVLNRIRAAGLETERAAAVQQITERLRSAPFGTVQPKDESDPVVVGGYRFWWSVIPETLSSNY